jgi:hypothetical protein
MNRMWAVVLVLGLPAAVACADDPPPTSGTYTVEFPSTAAAVATDFVQILIFDVAPQDRARRCGDLIAGRLGDPASLEPAVDPAPAANICEMRAGRKPVTVPHGEHALLAIGQRKSSADEKKLEDFLIGCAIMTIGDGNAPLPIPVRLVSVDRPVPPTACTSVTDYCDDKCD